MYFNNHPHLSFSILVICALLTACQTQPPVEDNGPQPREFTIKRLAKSDINTVVEVHLESAEELLQNLMTKLYKRNPVQLQHGVTATAEQRLQQVFNLKAMPEFPQLQHKQGVECIHLALDPEFQGDRVLAMIVGLITMLRESYNNQREFYLFSSLEPQKLFNSARNIEIAVWKLSNTYDADGQLLILSNSQDGEIRNLSYERLFGKLISLQDSLAIIVADGSNRIIKKIFQNMATAIFLPV